MIRYFTFFLFLSIVGIIGCKQEAPRIEIEIPESIVHLPYGKIGDISPRSLVDSLNKGADIDVYYIQELAPENPDHIVQLPGMKTIAFADSYTLSLSLPKDRPVYLICLYGDDSKKVAETLAKDGISSYCLVGGSYNLYNQIQKNRWKIVPHTTKTTR